MGRQHAGWSAECARCRSRALCRSCTSNLKSVRRRFQGAIQHREGRFICVTASMAPGVPRVATRQGIKLTAYQSQSSDCGGHASPVHICRLAPMPLFGCCGILHPVALDEAATCGTAAMLGPLHHAECLPVMIQRGGALPGPAAGMLTLSSRRAARRVVHTSAAMTSPVFWLLTHSRPYPSPGKGPHKRCSRLLTSRT